MKVLFKILSIAFVVLGLLMQIGDIPKSGLVLVALGFAGIGVMAYYRE